MNITAGLPEMVKRLLFSLLFLSVFSPVYAGQVHKEVLENGMTVLVQEMPSSEVLSIDAYIKTGSAVEGEYSGTGISHFIEHMLFKGTAKRPVGAIAKEVKALGGTINASTSFDYTIYTLNLPSGNFERGLDIIADMVVHSAFDPAEVEKEREVIHGEMRLYHDRPDRRLSDLVFNNVYIRHPYRHPIIGYPSLFDGITREGLYAYYKSRYIPNDIILSVAGPVHSQKALPLIKEAFKDFKPRPYPQHNTPQEPPQIAQRRFEDHFATPLVRFSLAYQGVSVADPDLYALDVLAMALGQGEGSRLYQDIYEKKKLVEGISASNFTPQDKGMFAIEGVMSKDNLSVVLEETKSVIEQIQRSGLDAEELAKTKRQVLSQFVFSNQTSSSLAYRAAVDEAMTGDPYFSKKYVDAVKNIGNEDIKRAAQRYLRDDHLTIAVLRPMQGGLASGTLEVKPQKSDIQKIVLDNGLTVLLGEDHSTGVIAMDCVFNAGTRQENPGLSGLSTLVSRVWTKGVEKNVENRGGFLSGFAGRNSIGLSMNVLSDDLSFALDAMQGLLAQPSFPADEIEHEKTNMAADIDARDDDIAAVGFKELFQILYLTHPFGRDVLGTKESVQRITRPDVVGYYQRFVRADNAVLAVFGDFDPASVTREIRKKFSGLSKGKPRLKEFQEPPPDRTREKTVAMDKEQAVVMMGFQAPVLKDKDRWAMEVIDALLGSGLSGRLFIKVRDELGEAYTVGSDYTPGMDAGVLSLFVLTTEDKIDSVKGILTRQAQALVAEDVTDEEIRSAKAYLKGTFKMGLDTPAALASLTALNELYGLGYDFHKDFDARINAVTKQDIRRVARKYLDARKSAVVTIKKRPNV
ncbi:MAG: insulinase family protein [Candidatus Omnitrophica bacterium]|nr:insulinase family protein [Candidatus Omnitrophota bacterium]